jgi:hypothetical protein
MTSVFHHQRQHMNATASAPTLQEAGIPHRRSGRVAFEPDGRSIWEWQTSTGVFERTVTDEQVARLESAELSLLEDSEPKRGTLYAHASRVVRHAPKPGKDGNLLTRILRRFGSR